MITPQDYIDAINKKIFNEDLKAAIRRIYAPNIADRLCAVIDAGEEAEHLTKFCNELMEMFAQYQRQQQQYLDALYKNYYGNY